jgi:2-polyprenyl-6-methoxyphenol hydroxylase-like FAD-dependent oxidoreductase
VIVGGGPVGLASALTLSNPPHSYDVTLLEKAPSLATIYDPTRAYQYNVNRRGLSWIDQYECVQTKLEARGSAPSATGGGFGNIVYIPSDPGKPIPSKPQVAQVAGSKGSPAQPRVRSYWIPRHQMVEMLEECCRAQEEARIAAVQSFSFAQSTKSEVLGSISILRGKNVIDLKVADQTTHELKVVCADGAEYMAALVVAADGMDSAIRGCLATSPPPSPSGASTDAAPWLHAHAPKFRIRRYRSPSTGLRMKSLQFPPDFVLTNTTGERIPTNSETMYVFRGVNTGPRDYVSLGLLPVKDPTLIRPANINTRPNHILWYMTEGSQVKEFFQRNYPRVNWDELVNDAEWDRFAKAAGTTYPFCQYSPGSAVVSPRGNTGVVLVGDACHAFPPDIGQGINAGLQDVVALDRALKGLDVATGQPPKSPVETLGQALLRYQANRGPEHAALIRLARCGAPYQYRQAWIRDRVGRFLWTMNVALRMFLNRVSAGLIPPAAILIAQDHTKSFRVVMRRASVTSRTLKLLAAAVTWFLWKRRMT